MKALRYLIFILCVVEFCSCKPKVVQIPEPTPWYAVTITSENNTVVTILADSDTISVRVIHSGDFFYRPKKIITDTLRFAFTKTERDSLYGLATAIIADPPSIRHHCTDFVGDLKIVIYYGQSCKKMVDYSGVCNWNILSDKTMLLHNILKRHMKKVFLGEDDNRTSHVGG